VIVVGRGGVRHHLLLLLLSLFGDWNSWNRQVLFACEQKRKQQLLHIMIPMALSLAAVVVVVVTMMML